MCSATLVPLLNLELSHVLMDLVWTAVAHACGHILPWPQRSHLYLDQSLYHHFDIYPIVTPSIARVDPLSMSYVIHQIAPLHLYPESLLFFGNGPRSIVVPPVQRFM